MAGDEAVMFRSVCMVISVIFMRSVGLGAALKSVLFTVVKICKRHYIWCLTSAQATTGSVPGSFDSFLELHQIILSQRLAELVFIF